MSRTYRKAITVAGKKKVAPAYSQGIWVHILGVTLPFSVFTEKLVKVALTRGRVSWETKTVPPFAVLCDPRNRDAQADEGGIRGIKGHIFLNGEHTDEKLTSDGGTYFVVEGDVIPFEMVAGFTGKEGGLTKTGKLRKRNPKYDTGSAGVQAAWQDGVYTLRVGVSQTTPNGLFLYGSARPQSEAREVEETDFVDASDLLSFIEDSDDILADEDVDA